MILGCHAREGLCYALVEHASCFGFVQVLHHISNIAIDQATILWQDIVKHS